LGGTVAKQLPFKHALSGGDTTSSMLGLGKATSYKKITRRLELAKHIKVFGNLEAPQSQLTEVRMPVLDILYGGNLTYSLDRLRYVQYLNLLGRPGHQLSSFAPWTFATATAASYHLYRVHWWVAQLKLLSNTAMDYLKWGWYKENDKFWPIMTDLEAALEDLRRIVKCSCKAGTDRSCVTQTCSCKRHSLLCIHGADGENRHEEISSSSNIPEDESFLAYIDEPGVDEEVVETACLKNSDLQSWDPQKYMDERMFIYSFFVV
jgi:hypothetical protein